MKPKYNIKNSLSLEENYAKGLLPQRNNRHLFYQHTSCRSRLNNFKLNSENRRILKKTPNFSFQKIPLSQLNYTPQLQKQLSSWCQKLGWRFPTSSIKNVFTNHIFNYVYIWHDQNSPPIAYSLCYFSASISHIAYVFYHPRYDHSNLPIRLVLQVVIDSHQLGLQYCYLGRFSPKNGFYKRNMPGFQYFNFVNHSWQTYQTRHH